MGEQPARGQNAGVGSISTGRNWGEASAWRRQAELGRRWPAGCGPSVEHVWVHTGRPASADLLSASLTGSGLGESAVALEWAVLIPCSRAVLGLQQ